MLLVVKPLLRERVVEPSGQSHGSAERVGTPEMRRWLTEKGLFHPSE